MFLLGLRASTTVLLGSQVSTLVADVGVGTYIDAFLQRACSQDYVLFCGTFLIDELSLVVLPAWVLLAYLRYDYVVVEERLSNVFAVPFLSFPFLSSSCLFIYATYSAWQMMASLITAYPPACIASSKGATLQFAFPVYALTYAVSIVS